MKRNPKIWLFHEYLNNQILKKLKNIQLINWIKKNIIFLIVKNDIYL
jgi:hypothetical protein